MKKLVSVVFMQGQEHYELIDMFETYQQIAEYLAQWDNGAETDMAAEYNGDYLTETDMRFNTKHAVNGIEYTLSHNPYVGYSGLSREVLRD